MPRRLAFITRQNIDLFVGRLETERDPATRAAIRRLLLEEVDRLLQPEDRLRVLEQQIERAAERIRLQSGRLARLSGNGAEAETARALLANSEDIHQLFLARRLTVLDGYFGGPI